VGRGRFIVIEGIDGAGTTTQANLIAQRLGDGGHKVLVTREPSDGPIGVMLRQALGGALPPPGGAWSTATLALLFAADRTDHLQREVLPALESGQWVLCDRYLLSSLAYQGAELPMAWVESINRTAAIPDLTLFVEVDPDVAEQRRGKRGGPVELFDEPKTQRKIARQYEAAVRLRARKERIRRIDGNGTVEEVLTASLAAVREELRPRRRRVSGGS
jgi:dTMP kinase